MTRSWRIEVAHDFPVPRADLWRYITTPANWPGYWTGVTEVRDQTYPDWPTVGNEVTLDITVVGRRRPLRLHVDHVLPQRLMHYTSTQPGLPQGHFELQLADVGPSTRYRISISYTPRKVAYLFDRYVVSTIIRRDIRKTLSNLHALLDEGTVPVSSVLEAPHAAQAVQAPQALPAEG